MQAMHSLNRDHAVSPEEEMQIHASGDNEHIEGRWKNPTGYRIENAILVLTNRIVFLGDLEPGEEGTFSEKSIPMEMEAWKKF